MTTETIKPLFAIILLIIIVCIIYSKVNYSFGRHIEVDWSRHRIYGWYNGHLLASGRFSYYPTTEEINQVKQQVAKELDERIKTYKEVKKLK